MSTILENIYIFYILLFLIAFLYASVGHGGASGYLAIMAIFSFSPDIMKPSALLLNLFVSLTSFIQFYRGKHFIWKIFWPLALASVPFAFLGGLINFNGALYKTILGILLLIPAARFLFFPNPQITSIHKTSILLSLLIGASIGFLSGLIGIGGGILLSPVLLLLHWTNQKQTAAISALFIFVNSVSGLAGQLSKGIHFNPEMFLFCGIAFAGGLAGAYLGALQFKQTILKNILAIVLLMAAIKLIKI